jgi:hypothetical protein
VAQKEKILQWEITQEERMRRIAQHRAVEAEKHRRATWYRTALYVSLPLPLLFALMGNYFLVVASLVCIGVLSLRIRANREVELGLPPPMEKPFPLEVVRYTKWENDYLLSRQPQEDFRAMCECPGCGFTDTHMLTEGSAVPWGDIFRVCGVCGREWVQQR